LKPHLGDFLGVAAAQEDARLVAGEKEVLSLTPKGYTPPF